ncbi:MAG: hypothetical protein RL661_1350 [Pseudomonadota bacterium]
MRGHNFVRVLRPLWLFALLCSSSTTAAQNESSVTLRSALAVREAFEKTEPVSKDSGTLKVPAMVSEKLFARFFSISKATYPLGDDPAWVKKQFALGRQGIGRYFIFVGDHTLIEKALISGQYNPNEIMANVGYGPGATCSSSQNYWLVVFRPKSQAVSAVYQQNLQKWFNHVYGASHAPNVSQQTVDSLVSNRFASVTECPLDPVRGAFQWSNLDRCSPLFAKTVTALNDKQCVNPNALTYSASNQCPTDKVLQSLGPNPSAIQLRAWLFAASSFSEFYTGNGYASNFYNSPANREYWVDNVWLQKLPEVELLKIQCPANTPNIGFAQGTSMNPIVIDILLSLKEEDSYGAQAAHAA